MDTIRAHINGASNMWSKMCICVSITLGLAIHIYPLLWVWFEIDSCSLATHKYNLTTVGGVHTVTYNGGINICIMPYDDITLLNGTLFYNPLRPYQCCLQQQGHIQRASCVLLLNLTSILFSIIILYKILNEQHDDENESDDIKVHQAVVSSDDFTIGHHIYTKHYVVVIQP